MESNSDKHDQKSANAAQNNQGERERVATGAVDLVSGQWRDIKSAPKDAEWTSGRHQHGPLIIAYPVGHRVDTVYWWQTIDGKASNFLDGGGNAAHPTHWMPLPAPPTQATESSEASKHSDGGAGSILQHGFSKCTDFYCPTCANGEPESVSAKADTEWEAADDLMSGLTDLLSCNHHETCKAESHFNDCPKAPRHKAGTEADTGYQRGVEAVAAECDRVERIYLEKERSRVAVGDGSTASYFDGKATAASEIGEFARALLPAPQSVKENPSE